MFAPPTESEQGDLFAPPEAHEIGPTPKVYADSDFQALAQKHGVSAQELKELAPYYGVTSEVGLQKPISEAAKYTAGFAGRSLGLGVPQFLYKKAQEPNMRKALDELTEIGRSQQGVVEKAAELAAPGGAIGQASERGAVRVLGGAATGAGIGAANAPEGEELRGAATGAALGGGLGLAGEGLAKIFGRNPSAVEQKVIQDSEIDIGRGAEEVASRTQDSEKLIDDMIFGRKEALTQQDAEKIVEQQLSKDSVARMRNPETEEGQLIRSTAAKRGEGAASDEAITRQLADDIVDSRTRSFAEELTGNKPSSFEEALNSIDEVATREGPQAIRNKYDEFRKLNQAERYLTETGARASDQPNFFGRAANFMSDNQFVLRHLDDKYGTDLEGALRDANKAFNRSTYPLQEFRKDQATLFKGARSLGVDDQIVNSTKLYDALDTGNLSALTPQEQKAAEGFRAYFDKMRSFANSVSEKAGKTDITPLRIPYLRNYVPKQLLSIPETISVLEKKLEAVQKAAGVRDLGRLNPQQYKQLHALPEMQDLLAAARMFQKSEPATAREFADSVRRMIGTREGNIALESAARAAMERKGGIPQFLLEKNLYKLADKYAANTIRHLYMRAPLDKLRFQAKALRKAGADVEAKYVENIIQDVLGVRSGTAAEAMMQAKIGLARKLDSAIDRYGKDSVIGGGLSAVKAIPDMFAGLTRQIYPNLLGYFNLRAITQNATQSLTKLAPELGTVYGHTTLGRAALYTVANFNKMIERARALGNVPAEFSRVGERAVASGIQRSAPYAIPKAALEGMGRVGMSLYQKMEELNRALALGVGDMMAHDLARGSKMAQGALAKFPKSVQRSIARAGTQEEAARILGMYLNDATQFNYNRASLSEFGRTMGPFFSAFSKWPTATAGDIIYEFRSKGLLKGLTRNAEKYIAPLLLLAGMDEAMKDKHGELSDIQKKLVGTHGLTQTAPIGAVRGMLTGEIFTPPVVDAAMQTIIGPMMEQDLNKARKGVVRAAENFMPGAGLIRFLMDDLATYATGRRPEGSNLIERAPEGMERLERKLK